MNLLVTLPALLAPLAEGGYHDAPVPQGVSVPYLAWQRIPNGVQNNAEGAAPIDNTQLQVTAWASTRLAADTLAESVIAAMNAAVDAGTFGCWLVVSPHDTYDPTTRLRGVILEFSIWH